jgi:ABC-type proline/glycine betaine transport system permease subunit
MRTDPDLLLDAGWLTAEHLLFVMLAVAVCLVAGMAAGIWLMSGLLPAA